jgi:hypothetical protein
MDMDRTGNSLWYGPTSPAITEPSCQEGSALPVRCLVEASELTWKLSDGELHALAAGQSLDLDSPTHGDCGSVCVDADAVFVDRQFAREVKQPGDGSCLFHALCYALDDGTTGHELRREVSKHIKDNPNMEIANLPLKDWVKLDCGRSLHRYAAKIAAGAEGGAIEMEVFSRLKNMKVHVYERCSGGYRRTCCFDGAGPKAKGTANVLYRQRRHYDSLVFARTP